MGVGLAGRGRVLMVRSRPQEEEPTDITRAQLRPRGSSASSSPKVWPQRPPCAPPASLCPPTASLFHPYPPPPTPLSVPIVSPHPWEPFTPRGRP